ncbi:MAG: LamG domain-containing protein, partial [Candidatus Nanoarchaeia archaeon]
MHKKEIKGKVYFYTSYRDKNGKVITKYLGSSRKEAKKNEDKLKHRKKKKKSRWFFFIILTVLLLSLLLTLNASSENLTVLNDSEIILTNLTPSFEINQETEISELNLSTTEINETIELTYTENDSNLTKEELTYNENYENITEELAYNEIEENMTFDNIIFEENITQETNTTEETTPAIDNTALPETNTTENATESSNQTSRFSTQGFTTEDYQTSDTGICDEGDEDTTCNLTTPHVFATNQEFNFTELYIQPGGSIELTSGANLTLNASIIIMEDTANITAQVVNITAENLTINVGAIINVNTKGFGPGAGPGKGGNGGGLGYPAGGAGYGGGGAFGYYSGTYYYGGDAYGNFSEPLDLGSGGGCSSSNCAYGPGGPGGGLIVTDITNTLTINGEITSEGGNGTLSVGGQGGGGSGGSILLKASTITGTGNITANGGPADTYADSNYAGSGGGGRIAIWYNTNEFGGDVNASTSPYGIYRGEAGTIYYWDMDDGIEEVVVDNLGYGTIGVASGCPLSGHLDFLNVSNRANATVLPNNDLTVNNTLLTGNSYIDAQDNVTLTESFTISSSSIYSSANLVIANIFEMLSGTIYFRGLLNLPTNQIENITLAYGPGGLLEEPDNSLNLGSEATLRFVTDNELNFNELNVSGQVESATNSASTFYAVNISAVNMTILEGGNISVEGRGNTSGPGKGGNSNNYAGAGGGYGGGGAPGYENGYVYGGNAYGNFSEPLDLGSAGGKGNWGTCPSGGSGGGLIILNVSDTLNVSGVIDADGGVANDLPSNCFSGGGSGGSVLIKTNILTGSGNITAFGGASNKSATSYYGGSGGGGRIAIWYYVMDEFYADVNASTSDGYYDGDAGTIYYLDQQNNVESMTVDNNGLSSSGLASGTPISGHLDFLNVSNRANATINVNDEANISNIVINGNSILTIFGNLTTGKFDLVSGTLYSLGSNTTIQELSTLSGSIIFGGGTLKIPINLIENVTFYYLTGGILDVPDNSLQIESNGVLQFNTNDELSFEELNVSGLITSSTNSVSTFYAVNISANNITITETGAIDVAAKGNASVVSSGATNGYGPGGGTYGGGSNNYCGGGGYGGLGGNGTGIDARGGLTYGSMITPLDLGSSGAASSGRGTCTTGAGGGLIRINASDTLNISGNINASGGDALTCGGGGSGGSIYLTATRFVGTGNIEAKGGRGNSTSYDGGGGGGRIALHYGTFDYEGTNSTAGGTGSNTGMTGTVYIADLDPPNITLVLPENNSNVESPGEVNFTFIASSDKPVNNCTIFINDEPSTSNQTDIILNTDHNISIILIPNTYTWNVRCYDETEKEGISDTWNFTFTLDETSPTINLLLPEDSTTNVTSNVIDFTYNVTDASDVNCSLVIQNGDDISINVTTDFLLDKDVNQNLTTYLDNAEYNWTINCTDAANNEGTAEWRNLSVLQYAAPSVILIEPENFNSTVELTSQIIFNCTATSDRGLVNITLYGNWQSIGWHANETTTVTGNSAEANFNKIIGYSDIFTDRRIRWNCKAEDTEGREAFASSDYYFSGWDFGSYGNSSYNNQSVGLDSDSLGEYSAEGNYTSKVFDAGSNANWNLLQWLPATPYGQELPNNGENETSKYPNGADMSGNVLLMHMNEESGNVIDNSGMGNTGTVNGEVVYGNVGKFNNSISFNGSGDYIEVSDTASLDITNELTIEAWVNNDKDSTTNKFQTIISKWGYTETMGSGSFQGLNISQINGYDTVGYDGAVFDGRYLYLVPVANATGSSTTGGHGIFLRYDTQAEFTNESFIAYDASRTDGLVAEGYHGGVYDGRYIYFAPYRNSSTATATEGYHAVALRYDTQGGFTNAASWTAYDASYTGGIVTTGYYDAVFDGRYVYYVPLYNGSTNGYHGVVLRYDTTKNFTDPESWDSYNAGYTNSTTTMGYLRGVFDGKYVYFIPYYAVISGTAQYHGNVLRYDTTKEFNDMTAWDGYNAGNISGLNTKGYTGAVYDGRYIYFSQYYDGTTFNSNILRYDTWEDFGKSSSWIAYDADAGVGNSACVGYFNMEFDGRYAYFLPYYNGSGSSHGNILRYDTTQNFTSSAAWSCYDASNSINCGGNCKAYIGSGFDGRYIYMTPYYNGVYHDMMLRFDTTSSNSSYRLMYSDIQTKDAVLTSPSFTINTAENHTYSATSFTNISSGWHHIAGVFNGTGVRIYIDGVLQGDNPAAGTIAVNVAELTIGKLTESIGYFNGSIDEIAIYNRSLSDDEIRDHYMRGAAKLNFTVRSCNDAECDVEPWSGDYDNWTENNISLLDINRYFQYKAYFYTE